MRKQMSVSSVVQSHTSERLPTVSILGYALAGDGLARVVVEVAHNRASREDHNLVLQSLSKTFDNKLVGVSGSFHSVDKAPYTERVEGIVRINTQAVAVTEKMTGFRAMSSNIFMDEEEHMWTLRKTESGDILVKNTGIEDHESLRNLMDVACCSGFSLSSEFQRATSSISAMQNSVEGGDFVEYVSTASGSVRYGFVVAAADEDKLIVLPVDDPDIDGEVIEKDAVTGVQDSDDFPDTDISEQEEMDVAVSTSRGVVDINVLVEYYRKVYGHNQKFFNELVSRIKGHAFA